MALVEIHEGHDTKVSDYVARILKELKDIMPSGLPP